MGSFNLLSLLFFLIPFTLFADIRVLCIGDSNTRGVPFFEDGWDHKLKNDIELQRYGFYFENYSFGYATTSQCEQLLMELLQHHKYDIMIYNPGLVDVLSKCDLQQFEESMDRTLGRCIKKIPIIFFGMIDFTCWTVRRNDEVSYISKANEIFVRMSHKYPVIAYEFLTTDLLCHEKCNVGDWIHPNEVGIHLIYLKVKEELLKILSKESTIKLELFSEFIP